MEDLFRVKYLTFRNSGAHLAQLLQWPWLHRGKFLEGESFVRKGEAGGWRKYFTQVLISTAGNSLAILKVIVKRPFFRTWTQFLIPGWHSKDVKYLLSGNKSKSKNVHCLLAYRHTRVRDDLPNQIVCFLAVQNSSIGNQVTLSLTHWLRVLLLLTYKERP